MYPTPTKNLIRRCKCGNTVAVAVSGECVLVPNSGHPKSILVYENLEILNDSGFLRKRIFGQARRRYGSYYAFRRVNTSRIKDLSRTNRNGFRAVFCNCGRILHLSQFVEPTE